MLLIFLFTSLPTFVVRKGSVKGKKLSIFHSFIKLESVRKTYWRLWCSGIFKSLKVSTVSLFVLNIYFCSR